MNKNLCSLLAIIALVLTCISPCCSKCSTGTNPGFTGMFGLGDSIVDIGNNNFLQTGIKADYAPYGIDFPSGQVSSGRFTNGKNYADMTGDLLGLPLVPKSSDPQTKGVSVSRGVNHASAGSGVLDSTASNMGIISLNQQIRDFVEVTLPMLKTQQDCQDTNLLQQYLFLISAGSNDFLMNFFKGELNIGALEYFSDNLTSTLGTQLTRLYNAGARNFAFINIGPIGCTPMVRAAMPNKACNETVNYAAYYFNTQLNDMLDKMKPRMPGLQFSVVNFFQIGLEFIRNPSFGGFTDVEKSCCEVTAASDGVLCKKGGNVCADRSKYVFFDGLHPTEALYRIVATRAYNSTDQTEVYPYNLRKLASQI